jgi:hypothetical protein
VCQATLRSRTNLVIWGESLGWELLSNTYLVVASAFLLGAVERVVLIHDVVVSDGFVGATNAGTPGPLATDTFGAGAAALQRCAAGFVGPSSEESIPSWFRPQAGVRLSSGSVGLHTS